MKLFRSEEDLREMVDVELGYSQWHQITQRIINEFGHITGDLQWIHVDVDRAVRGPFGSTVAHGFLLVSLIPTLVSEVYGLLGEPVRINYGFNKVRFPSPVPVGSQIRASARLRAVTNRNGRVLVETDVSVESEGSAVPACTAQWMRLVAW